MAIDDAPTTALVPARDDSAAPLPVPLFGGPQMAVAFRAYRDLQRVLDESMPDQIMRIGDRSYRKKGYWRAVAVAFNVDVKCVHEARDVDGEFEDGRPNFGYLITCVATAPNGRSQEGDGACYAVEKAEKFRCPHPQANNPNRSEHYPHERCPDFDPEFRWRELPPQATVHNVRAHAYTRAYNRAVSNLVGFGEVSAEEIEPDDPERGPAAPPRRATSTHGATAKISEPQRKRLYAIGTNAGWQEREIKQLLARHGFEHAADITRDKYDAICKELEEGAGS